MWCGFDKSKVTIALTCMVAASVVSSDMVFAARQRNYQPDEFRSVLRGLGYNVKVTKDPLTDEETKKAITEFQTGYKLKVDGKVGPQTQNQAAIIVEILQANLNTVLKPNTLLPRDQFYSSQVEELVKEYQKKHQLPENGIADLRLRQKLNEEVKNIIGKPVRDFQLKKYPKISCGAGILGLSLSKGRSMPMPQDWIIFFVEFSK